MGKNDKNNMEYVQNEIYGKVLPNVKSTLIPNAGQILCSYPHRGMHIWEKYINLQVKLKSQPFDTFIKG